MARGSIVKRCPICRTKEGRTPQHTCPPQEASYYIVYRVNQKQKWEFGGFTKRDAERLLSQRLSEINGGTYREPKRVAFCDFAQTWLDNCPRARVKESTLRGYTSDINRHLNPALGDRFLHSIGQEDVQAFLSKLRQTLNPKTVNNIRLTLYMILGYAKRLKYIPENPVEDIKPYKVEYEEMDFLSPDEIRLLLHHAQEPARTLFLTAILTGMRRGELLALQWGDVEWHSNTIFVRRSIYWRPVKNVPVGQQRWSFVSPKSKRSVRAIVMSPKLKEALEIHHISSANNPFDLVFVNGEGRPLDPDNMVKRDFLPTLRLAGLRQIRFHDLRHTYVALLIAQGENVKFIQSQLGHASIQTTMDRYGHLFPVSHVAVGERIDRQLFGGPSNTCLTKPAETAPNITYQQQRQPQVLVDKI